MEKADYASERLEKVDAVLDDYEESVGLPKFSPSFHDDSAKKYLQLSRTQIEKLSPNECAEASILLTALAFHVQRSYNRAVSYTHLTLPTILLV